MDNDFHNTKPLDPVTEGRHERLFLDLLTLLAANDVPTYFDQIATYDNPNAQPWDGHTPRRVMEPAERLRWVIGQFSELKRKNSNLSMVARELEQKLRDLADTLRVRHEEFMRACMERDNALKKVAKMMLDRDNYAGKNTKPVSRRGREGSKKTPR